MSFDFDSLYRLLPAVHRVRDAESGEPLKALLSVLADQLGVLEEDLDRLYDDQFIETCAGWVIPYIGDAIGYRPLYGNIPRIRTPRAEVADTIALRRHKGTAAMLEVLAREVTGWDARVVEFFQLLATTQYLNHPRPGNTRPEMRKWEPLEQVGTAFETIPHNADVRRIASGRGRFNIPNLGIFLWRLGAYSHTRARAFALDAERFLFSPLGNSVPLFTRPVPLGAIDEFTRRAGRLNLPMPIGRRTADRYLADYYGVDQSFFVWADGVEVDISEIHICDLGDLKDAAGQPTGDWAHVPAPAGEVAIDPVLGRIAFADPPQVVEVLYHRGFSMDLGGGEYDRQDAVGEWYQPRETPVTWQRGVTQDPNTIATAPDPTVLATTLVDALADWNAFTALNTSGFGLICVMDSRTYPLDLAIEVPEGFTLAVVAADWPVNQSLNQRQLGVLSPSGRFPLISGDVEVTGTAPAASENPGTLILDGLLLGGSVTVTDEHLGRLLLSHCTVVPWTSVGLDRLPLPTTSVRLLNEDGQCRLEAEHCVLGATRSPRETRARFSSCILDATDETHVAFSAPDGVEEGSALTIVESTVLGKVRTRVMDLASNSIFVAGLATPDPDWTAPVRAERRQVGCVRFSRVPEGSRLPRRHRCQPDLALKARAKALGLDSSDDLSPAERTMLFLRLRPMFRSLRYGDPAYAQLSRRCAREIREGADDGAEMGAFHDLYQPQRERNLRIRLDEYLRFGLEAGVFYET
ncbi:MAG: hypothetical protein ACREMX_13775 [Gemmatimonadales bacterium]